jgi:translation initiation factor IF-2
MCQTNQFQIVHSAEFVYTSAVTEIGIAEVLCAVATRVMDAVETRPIKPDGTAVAYSVMGEQVVVTRQ